MPKNEELRAEVIRLHHNIPAAGYGGRWKTGVGNKKLLVARSDKRCRKICGRVQSILEDEK